MKLVVGLGNPGKQYENNRHNVGHMVVDELARQVQNSKLKNQNYNAKLKVIKLQAFMNESGRAVKKLVSNLAIKQFNNLIVVHDDLDIKLGEYKIQKGKGPKRHKGIESVDEALGTRQYWRVRVGVDNRDTQDRISGEEYVLQDFTPEERVIVEKVTKEVVAQLIARTNNAIT